jgi:ribA/ribD-fused uncharacterized protein
MSTPFVPIAPGNSDQVINSFSGEYEFLSTFWPCTIRMYGLVFLCAEQLYQWHKLAREEDRQLMLTQVYGLDAKRFGRKCLIIPDWDDIRTGVMLTVLLAKFEQNSGLKLWLGNTRPKLLIAGNHWGDTYWGKIWTAHDWLGENHLGRLLMIVRDVLCL